LERREIAGRSESAREETVVEVEGGRREASERMAERALATDPHQEGGGLGLLFVRASAGTEVTEEAEEVVGEGDPPLAAIWSRR
jgi:hypothetical protein